MKGRKIAEEIKPVEYLPVLRAGKLPVARSIGPGLVLIAGLSLTF